MPALLLLVSALGLNYHRHRHGRSTICSTSRRAIGPRLMVALWLFLTAWFLPHYCRPFARAVLAAVETFDDELASAFTLEETP